MQRILVVDDAELNRNLLREILKEDYVVELARDGEQALRKLEKHLNETAALLLDLRMPKMDGFEVVEEMRKKGWIQRIPVLIISSECAAEIENRCFQMGVSDFIRKPFVSSTVKNRLKNTIELFECKNQLQMKVEEQEETLKKQSEIIRIQTEKLREAKSFNRLMTEYRSAIMEVESRLKSLNAEFSQEYNRNPFESIKSRLKTPESIYEKLERKGYPATVENIKEHLMDVAGVRVICSFPDDIYRLAELFTGQDDIVLLRKKMNVEVQFRTIAMDFWASLEHKLKYKKDVDDAEEIVSQLKVCADSIETLDYRMQEIRDRIDKRR